MNYYVAVDIGASSGRLLLAHKLNGKVMLKEVHRFKNGFKRENRHDRWQIDYLIREIFKGLEKIKLMGIKQVTLGIDTWAVDYVLIGDDGQRLCNPISYRDRRTLGSIEKLTRRYSKEFIYKKTGIQFLDFNTLYQLYEEDQDLLSRTDKILLVPDYLGYVLTGNSVAEVTNASTTQMLNLKEGLFDDHLLDQLKIRPSQFPNLVDAGTPLGKITDKWHRQYDIPECNVITVATHDTASAVVGTPGIGENWAFLSSGTWSLIGREVPTPENGKMAFDENYTNEWGAYGTYRFLKNIMGLWMIQQIKHEFNDRYSFQEMADLASQEEPFQQVIDVNDERFINPDNMCEALQSYCKDTNQTIPKSIGQLVNTVYSNLALEYANQIKKISIMTKSKITELNIVGGGSNVDYLNQLTSDLAGIKVIAGPGEATALGNILVQMITTHDVKNLEEGRELIRQSNELKVFTPQHQEQKLVNGG